MKVLVTGVAGQLGYDVCRRLAELNIEHKGVDIGDFNIVDMNETTLYVRAYNPTHIVHCAAYTAVDKAETERDICEHVNAFGTANLVRAAADTNAEIMYFSTDYVFDGISKSEPWEVDDIKRPINHYGETKYQGEQYVQGLKKHYVLRISWVFGKNGHNFVKTMLRLAESNNEINVVDDQVGAPTYTRDVAKLACDMLQSGKYGTYHAPNQGCCSWYEFAKEIFAAKGIDIKVNPISTAMYPTPADRPKNSRLSLKSLLDAGFELPPHYSDALGRYLMEL